MSLTKTEFKVILNEIFTPFAKKLSLDKYNTEYMWFSDFNESGIKHFFKYQLLKGDTGTIVYGNCFEFMPTISSTFSLKNHKTDKSTTMHLFELSEGWKKSLYHGEKLSDKVKHTNSEIAREGLNQLAYKYEDICRNWWDATKTIEGNIVKAINQLSSREYKLNNPSPNFCLIFLYWKSKNIDKAFEYFNSLKGIYSSHDERYKEIFDKIEKIISK